MTGAQKRRLMTGLKTDPTGFAETSLSMADTHACVTSMLSDPTAVDSRALTEYRRCALVELEYSALSGANPLQEACKTLADLGAPGIGMLLDGAGSSAVLRVLELESHAVIQLIGASEISDSAIRCLFDRHSAVP